MCQEFGIRTSHRAYSKKIEMLYECSVTYRIMSSSSNWIDSRTWRHQFYICDRWSRWHVPAIAASTLGLRNAAPAAAAAALAPLAPAAVRDLLDGRPDIGVLLHRVVANVPDVAGLGSVKFFIIFQPRRRKLFFFIESWLIGLLLLPPLKGGNQITCWCRHDFTSTRQIRERPLSQSSWPGVATGSD